MTRFRIFRGMVQCSAGLAFKPTVNRGAIYGDPFCPMLERLKRGEVLLDGRSVAQALAPIHGKGAHS